MFYVYILRCANNAYYTGYTTDLARRYQEHMDGRGSKYTRSFKPISIEQSWQVSSSSIAKRLEIYIKNLSRAEKSRLILSPNLLPIDQYSRAGA